MIDNLIDIDNQAERLRMGAELIRSGRVGMKQYSEFVFQDDKGSMIKFAPHHERMNNWIDEQWKKGYPNLWIEAHIGSGKTQNIALYRTTYEIGRNPNIRTKIICSSSDIATKRVDANKRTIADNEKFKMVFPWVKPDREKWGSYCFRVHNTGLSSTDYTMEAAGVTCASMGGRADLMVFDDVCDFNNTATQANREKLVSQIRIQWLSRIAPDGRVLGIGTPFHPDDPMREIAKMWRRLRIPVKQDLSCLEVYQDDMKIDELPLWREWSRERLLKFRDERCGGSQRVFDAMMHLIPYSDTDAFFKHVDQIIHWNDNPLNYKYKAYFGGVDLATKTRPGTVMTLIGIREDDVKIPVDIQILKDPALIDEHLRAWKNKWGADIHYVNVENNALQDALVDRLMRERILPLRAWTTGKNKIDPIIGLPTLDVQFENGFIQICIPHAPPTDHCPYCQLYRELKLYPGIGTWDLIMALWFAWNATKSYGRVAFV